MSDAEPAGRATGIVEVDYGQLYVFDPETGISTDAADLEWARAWELRAGLMGEHAAILLTRKHDGDTQVAVRVRADLPGDPDDADHVVELGFACPSGRLRVTGWDTQDGRQIDVRVPPGPVRVRVHWLGLEAAVGLEADEAWEAADDAEHLRLDVAPGAIDSDVDAVRVLRCWRAWVPPQPEGATPSGLRLLSGSVAEQHRATLEPVRRTFWTPYPELFGGHVTSLWRDPSTEVRWAHGTRNGHPMLAELTDAEADALDAQGFFAGYTFARDSEGHIWSSDQVPIERASCLNYIAPEHYATIRSMLPTALLDVREISLPGGWSRIYRRDVDGHTVGPIESVDVAASYGYQRWRDDGPGPAR